MLKTVQAATGGAVGGNVTITGGTIDNTVIGGTTAANGTFTNVWVGSNATVVSGARVQVTPSGDFAAGIAIGSTASATTWSRLDFKNANIGTSNFIYTDQIGLFGMRTEGAYPIVFYTNGANERLRIDSSGNTLVTNPALLGYGTGSGGTVTQATNKGTAVTLNKPTGQITTNNAALASGAIAQFTVNNSLVSATDTVIANYSNTPAFYNLEITGAFAGAFNVLITNQSGASRSDALVINFAVIKGATA